MQGSSDWSLYSNISDISEEFHLSQMYMINETEYKTAHISKQGEPSFLIVEGSWLKKYNKECIPFNDFKPKVILENILSIPLDSPCDEIMLESFIMSDSYPDGITNEEESDIIYGFNTVVETITMEYFDRLNDTIVKLNLGDVESYSFIRWIGEYDLLLKSDLFC
jgi:hypothetical protein